MLLPIFSLLSSLPMGWGDRRWNLFPWCFLECKQGFPPNQLWTPSCPCSGRHLDHNEFLVILILVPGAQAFTFCYNAQSTTTLITTQITHTHTHIHCGYPDTPNLLKQGTWQQELLSLACLQNPQGTGGWEKGHHFKISLQFYLVTLLRY